VAVIQVSIDEEDYLVPLYIKMKPASATMLVAKDQAKQVQDAYKVNGIPANFLIDTTGTIQDFSSGFGPGVPAELRRAIDAVLQSSKK
jgi:hypothetical protein